MKKNMVSAVVRRGHKNYGFCKVIKSSAVKIENALNDAYGKENIIICTIKEV